jgi:DNA-binding protein HU-beta
MKRLTWYERVGREVTEVLDLTYPKFHRVGPGYNAVRAVFKAIAAALQRGEKVSVYGFGTFELKHRAPKRVGVLWVTHDGKHRYASRGDNLYTQAKTIVVFKPSPKLRKLINES